MWGNMDQKNPKYGPFSRSDGSYEANPTKDEKVSLSVQYNRDKQSLKMLKIWWLLLWLPFNYYFQRRI